MAKSDSLFVCQQCGNEYTKWHGKCPTCGEWNSLVEAKRFTKKGKSKKGLKIKKASEKLVKLSKVKKKDTKRISTKIGELDRVLGGGIVPGQVILIAGEPGIGKSTILLQLADKLGKVLYASGEESVHQIKIRSDRLGIKDKDIELMEETDIETVISSVGASSNKLLIVDSIQTMQTQDLSGMAGSVGQVKECTYQLVRLAKETGLPIFIVGHVTKKGNIAGPSVLMHIVDTVLWFEGDKSHDMRMLRAVKNRFGPTDEVGVFEMGDKGLKDVKNPQKLFLTKGKKDSGICVASVLKGTRPILVEIQSLLVPSKMAFPKRVAQGIDSKRLELLLAVITKKTGLNMFEYDCFVNVTGGISVKNDPSTDLAIVMSIASSYFDKSLKKGTVAIGEVGLTGEIRQTVMQDKRIKEAKRLGYDNTISNKKVSYIREAIKKHLR